MKFAVTMVLLVMSLSVPETVLAQDGPSDREIFLELFRATDGPNWKRKAGWGTDATLCEWEGVWCFRDLARIDALQLWENNLRGTLPESLTRLAGLKTLNVSRNQLTGTIPAALLDRADANQLEFNFDGNRFAQSLVKIAMRVDQFTGVCSADDQLLKFSIEVDVVTNRATYQNVRCAPGCRRLEMATPPLDGISRALRHLSFPPAPDLRGPQSFTGHEEHIYLTLGWGDGRSDKDSRDGGRAPVKSWIAYELLLGLEPPGWETQAKAVDCRSLKWPD